MVPDEKYYSKCSMISSLAEREKFQQISPHSSTSVKLDSVELGAHKLSFKIHTTKIITLFSQTPNSCAIACTHAHKNSQICRRLLGTSNLASVLHSLF
jgi:hypothetical protein